MKAKINKNQSICCSIGNKNNIKSSITNNDIIDSKLECQEEICAGSTQRGPQGPKGDPGDIYNILGSALIDVVKDGLDVTISSKSYIHDQAEASDTWEIEHNLNKYPSVTLVDSAKVQFTAKIVHNSLNKCTVYMNGATKGKAYLN